MTERIGVEEWRAEIERVMGDSGDEGLTAREIAASLKLCVRTTMDRLRKLSEEGRLSTGRRRTESIDGVARWVPVYSIRASRDAR